jgi:hypothetical protein
MEKYGELVVELLGVLVNSFFTYFEFENSP